jgi:regulator of replication initiation timing
MSSYTQGIGYEMLIRRAHRSDRTMKNGADSAFMTNLIDAENGVKQFGLGSANKQLSDLKKYLVKAIDKFLKLKLSNDEKDEILSLKSQIERAEHSATLIKAIDNLLEITHRFI